MRDSDLLALLGSDGLDVAVFQLRQARPQGLFLMLQRRDGSFELWERREGSVVAKGSA